MTTFWPMLQFSPILRAGQDMREVPDFGSLADGHIVVDDGGWVDETVSILFPIWFSPYLFGAMGMLLFLRGIAG